MIDPQHSNEGGASLSTLFHSDWKSVQDINTENWLTSKPEPYNTSVDPEVPLQQLSEFFMVIDTDDNSLSLNIQQQANTMRNEPDNIEIDDTTDSIRPIMQNTRIIK